MPRSAARVQPSSEFRTSGAAPAGVRPGDEQQSARRIREMFGRVAPRYDLLNRLLSLRVDQYWRRVLARKLRPRLARPELRWLDLCCGTGDLALALEGERQRLCGAARRPGLASDFCRPMLTAARKKFSGRGVRAGIVEADALAFPLPGGSLDLITMAFGFRNLANYRKGLEEAHRLLAPGGCLAILEFSKPRNRLWGPLFEWYFRNLLPCIGNRISGAGDAYGYLQKSVEKFPSPDKLAAEMRSSGFSSVEYYPLTGGIAVLHLAVK